MSIYFSYTAEILKLEASVVFSPTVKDINLFVFALFNLLVYFFKYSPLFTISYCYEASV